MLKEISVSLLLLCPASLVNCFPLIPLIFAKSSEMIFTICSDLPDLRER
jgi:hypothetical protein